MLSFSKSVCTTLLFINIITAQISISSENFRDYNIPISHLEYEQSLQNTETAVESIDGPKYDDMISLNFEETRKAKKRDLFKVTPDIMISPVNDLLVRSSEELSPSFYDSKLTLSYDPRLLYLACITITLVAPLIYIVTQLEIRKGVENDDSDSIIPDIDLEAFGVVGLPVPIGAYDPENNSVPVN